MDTMTVTAGEPVEKQAPAVLPTGYLSDGYYATADNGKEYLRPAYVSDYAQRIAATLATTMKPSDFAALMRGLKSAKSRTLPFEARQTAAAEMLPKALSLVKRKKAPALLVDFIKANAAAVKDDEDFKALYRHMDAVHSFILEREGGDA